VGGVVGHQRARSSEVEATGAEAEACVDLLECEIRSHHVLSRDSSGVGESGPQLWCIHLI
jgi:hypothetical protein